MVMGPASDGPADALQRFRTGSGLEALREDPYFPSLHRLPGSKLKPEKVERNIWTINPSGHWYLLLASPRRCN
jgi:hypothetical protein